MSLAAAAFWGWAVALIATRECTVDTYFVMADGPPLWGWLILPVRALAVIAVMTVCWFAALGAVTDLCRPAWRAAIGWLLPAALVPGLDLLRIGGLAVPTTFIEPLLLAGFTGLAAERLAHGWFACRVEATPRQPWSGWFPLVLGLSVTAGIWAYLQAVDAYQSFLLGYHDFGHFARRVVNTSAGRGFLREAPDLPAFWDHFNPGLAALAPAWAVWPDARLFLLVQAICLVCPAPLVYGLARRWGFECGPSAMWAAAYLAFPSVSLLNLNYTYGWHPVSLALPLLFGSVLSLLTGRRTLALALLVLACMFKETVLVTAGCLAAAMAIARWTRNRAPSPPVAATSDDLRLADCLPTIAWVGIWLSLSLAMVVILQLTPFAQFQSQRFSNLGDSTVQILLSPVLRPAEFWGQVLSFPSVCFTLALLIPLHLPSLWRGRWTLLALVPPLGILLAWSYPVGRSIAFQYVTTLIPVLFLAAIAGAASLRDREPSKSAPPAPGRSPRCLAACVATLAASLTASVFFGATPYSSDTLAIVRAQTYRDQQGRNPRAPGTPGNQVLNRIIERLNRDDLAVLATGRVAAHLLNVRRLESVEQATTRWEALEQEAGEGRSAIHVFDWIVLDMAEHLQQSPQKVDSVLQEAISAGYVVQQQEEGILLLCRPGLADDG